MTETTARSGPEPAVGKVIFGISRQFNNLAMILITVMMVHICADVAGKYLFNAPIDGTLETVSLYYMVAVVFFPLAYATQNGGQIMVELFTRKLSERARRYLDGGVAIFGFLYMSLFAWETGIEAVHRTQSGEIRETAQSLIIVWPSRWILPLSFALMAAYLLYEGIQQIRQARLAGQK